MLIPRTVLASLPSHSDTESSRYALGGVFLERKDDTVYAVATDGRRLIAAQWQDDPADYPAVGLDPLPAPGSEFAETGKIIPSADCIKLSRTAKPKVRAAAKNPQLAYVAMEERTANGRAKFAATDGETTAALEVATIEGRFPKWRDVVPGERPRVSHFTFQTAEESDEQTKGFACDDAKQLRAETEAKPGHIRGAVVRVRVDARYLAELAAAIDQITGGDRDDDHGLTLEVPLDPYCPVVMRNEGHGVKVSGVVMPLRDK